MNQSSDRINNKPLGGWLALSPLLVFLCLYLVTSIVLNDFYKMPITVAFGVACAVAVAMMRGMSLSDRIDRFSQGAADKNILLMIWIFVLAGAFAQGAKSMGAIDAAVSLTLFVMPEQLLFAGLFLAACFVSVSIGTSVGTIVALVPLAVGIAEKVGVEPAFLAGIVVGGAFFGDNLSFISDTTIAATRTQFCRMSDKFKVNFFIVLPAAVIAFVLYVIQGANMNVGANVVELKNWVAVIPYLLVLGLAIAGVNVVMVLVLGIVATLIIGLATGCELFTMVGAMGGGIVGMGELIIVTLLAGGLFESVRTNGGIDYIIEGLTRRIKGQRGAEFAIAALVCVANFCTANNTIAILTTGSIAHDISKRFGLDNRKVASLLDTFSCFVQGIIPYGAQMMIAAGLTGVSPLALFESLYYPPLMGACALFAILLRYPRKYS